MEEKQSPGERQRDRDRERQRDRDRDTETERERGERQRQREIETETETERHRETDRQTDRDLKSTAADRKVLQYPSLMRSGRRDNSIDVSDNIYGCLSRLSCRCFFKIMNFSDRFRSQVL